MDNDIEQFETPATPTPEKEWEPSTQYLTVRQMLDQIDVWLCHRIEGPKLSYVMSALRGPDDPATYCKSRTTTYIRTAAFPKLTEKLDNGNSNIPWSMSHDQVLQVPEVDENGLNPTGNTVPFDGIVIKADENSHFFVHIGDAARVLGVPVKHTVYNTETGEWTVNGGVW